VIKVYSVWGTAQVEMKSGRVQAPASGLLDTVAKMVSRKCAAVQGLILVPVRAQLEHIRDKCMGQVGLLEAQRQLKLSLKVDECKPLPPSRRPSPRSGTGYPGTGAYTRPPFSST